MKGSVKLVLNKMNPKVKQKLIVWYCLGSLQHCQCQYFECSGHQLGSKIGCLHQWYLHV